MIFWYVLQHVNFPWLIIIEHNQNQHLISSPFSVKRLTWCAQKSRASRFTKSSSRFPCTKRSLFTICRSGLKNCFSRAWEIPSTDKQWTRYWKVSLRCGGSLLLPNCVMILNLCKLYPFGDKLLHCVFANRLFIANNYTERTFRHRGKKLQNKIKLQAPRLCNNNYFYPVFSCFLSTQFSYQDFRLHFCI